MRFKYNCCCVFGYVFLCLGLVEQMQLVDRKDASGRDCVSVDKPATRRTVAYAKRHSNKLQRGTNG